MVDGRDPEDGEYEFMFINDLTEVWYALQQRDKKH
jgi:hypothetical protein